MTTPDLIPINEAAAAVGYHGQSLRLWRQQGMPHSQPHGRFGPIMVRLEDAQAWAARPRARPGRKKGWRKPR